MLAAGTRLGPYEILAPLAAGGMAEVYRARDPTLDREVAVKVLPSSAAASTEALERFTQEARAASALNHPNIVTIHGIGEADGVRYMALELIDGRSLRDILRAGAMPLKKTLAVAAQVADGLAKAHEAGIVHRDLKPANVMVTKDGHVKILDFGVAKLQAPEAAGSDPSGEGLTSPGMVVGTAAYMSPEQARGEAIDFRSDQFSFGSLLYEMLSGKKAFDGKSPVQTMSALIETDPEPLVRSAPRVPPPVRWIVERCLAKEPGGRYAATRDLAHDIRAAESHITEAQATLPTARYPAAQPGMLRRLSAIAAGLGLFGAGALAAILLRPARSLPPAALQPFTYSGGDFSPAAQPGGRLLAFSSNRDGTPRIWLKDLDRGAEAPLTGGPDDYPRFSADGSRLVFVRQDPRGNALFVVPTLGGPPRKLMDGAVGADWMPDGKQIVFVQWFDEAGGRTTSIGTIDSDGGNPREVLRVPSQALLHPRASPDGREVAFTSSAVAGVPGAIVILDLASRKLRSITASSPGAHFSSPAWLPSGRELLALKAESVTPFVVNSNRAARLLRMSATGSGEPTTILWSPGFGTVVDVVGDGRLALETRAVRGNLREIPLDGGARAGRWLTRGNSTDRQPTYSTAGGDEIAFSSNRNGNWDLWAVSTKTGFVRSLTDHKADDWDPAFARGGKSLLWSSNRTGHFEVWTANADGTDARQLSSDGVDAENPTSTPDGEWVIYNSSNPAKAGVWKMRADGKEAALLVPGRTFLPEVSPDGKYVLYVTNIGTNVPVVRAARASDGAPTRFELRAGSDRLGSVGTGRSRWMPDGKAIATIGFDPAGNRCIWVQEFAPDKDTAATRRTLVALEADLNIDTFGVSPDGKRVTIEHLEELSSVMTAEGAGVGR